MPLINCEIELILTWSRNSAIISTDIANQTLAMSVLIHVPFHVPVVTLSTQENAKLLP